MAAPHPTGDEPGSGEDPGPLTRTVLRYQDLVQQLVPTARSPEDWEPLAAVVAVDDFVRVGTFLEVQSWHEYTVMLTQWASHVARFETTVHRISEVGDLVYFEIEERHVTRAGVSVVRSMTVFGFDGDGKIRHLDVYLQQPR